MRFIAMPFVNHVEFEVTDLKRAARFYKSVLGFKVKLLPRINYALWATTRKPSGGFSLVKRVRHGGTLAVFQVNDIDRHLMKARKFGGKIYRKKGPLPGGMGFYGAFKDPFGNIVGLWSNR
jgi:predicted enzyme related to lactoylglutathione lyase